MADDFARIDCRLNTCVGRLCICVCMCMCVCAKNLETLTENDK